MVRLVRLVRDREMSGSWKRTERFDSLYLGQVHDVTLTLTLPPRSREHVAYITNYSVITHPPGIQRPGAKSRFKIQSENVYIHAGKHLSGCVCAHFNFLCIRFCCEPRPPSSSTRWPSRSPKPCEPASNGTQKSLSSCRGLPFRGVLSDQVYRYPHEDEACRWSEAPIQNVALPCTNQVLQELRGVLRGPASKGETGQPADGFSSD